MIYLHSTLIKYKGYTIQYIAEVREHLHSTLIKYKATASIIPAIVKKAFTFHSD